MSVRKEYEMAFRLRGVLEDTFKTSFGEACKMAIALEDEAKELDRVWSDYHSIQGYIEKQNNHAASIETVKGKLAKLKTEETQYREKLEELKKAQEAASDGTVNYSKDIEALENKIGKNLTKQETHNKSIEDYERKIEYAREEQERYKASIEALGYSYENYGEHLDEIKQGLEEVRQAEKRLAEINKERQQEYAYLQKNYQQLRKTAQIYRDIARVGWDTFIEPQARFEQTMSAVEAYSGATEQELARMETIARQIGKETKFTSSESAEAFETMALAGWNAQESIQGIPGVINLALVSQEDIGSTASTVTDNLNAFGLEIKDATHFTDVLAATATNSNTTIYGLAESLKYCNAIAGSMKFTAEDTSLMLGLLGDNGVKGSRAGTTMRRIMSALSEDLKLVKENGEEVTISTSDADGKMRSLDAIITDLRTHFNGMTEAERAAMKAGADLSTIAEDLGIDLLNENGLKKSEEELEEEIEACTQALKEQGKVAQAEAIAQKTGMSGLLAIMGTTDERYNDLKDSIYNCAGAAQKMADIKMDNLNGDIELVKSSWEELTMTAGEYFNEDLRQYTQNFKSKIDSTQEWIANNQDLIRTLVKLAGQLGVVTGGYIALKTGARGVNVVFKDIQKVGQTLKVSKAIKGVKDLASGTKTMGTVTKTLVSYIKSPGGALAVGGAVIAIIAGITAAWMNYKKKMEQEAIDKMFGDIALSMEECQRVARELVDSDIIRNTAEAFKAFEDVKYAEENLTSLKEKLDKYNWMVDVGLELTEEEASSYKETCEQYVSSVQQYIKDKGYAVTLGLKASFGSNSSEYISASSNVAAMTAQLQDFFKDAGEELSNAMNEGFENNFLNAEAIQKAIERVQELEEILTRGKREGEKEGVVSKYGGYYSLNYDSAKKIMEEQHKLTDEYVSEVDETYSATAGNYESLIALYKKKVEESPEDVEAKQMLEKAKSDYEAYKEKGVQGLKDDEYVSQILRDFSYGLPEEAKETLDNFYKLTIEAQELADVYGENSDEFANKVMEITQVKRNLNSADRKLIGDVLKYTGEHFDSLKREYEEAISNADFAMAEKIGEIIDLYTKYIGADVNLSTGVVSQHGFTYTYTPNKQMTPDTRGTFSTSYVSDANKMQEVYGVMQSGGITPWASFNIKGHAGGTNYTSDSFYAGENGRTELITGAAGKKVYTAFETSEILRNIREAEELLPYFNQMRSAASIQPKTLMTAFEGPRQTVIEFTHAPVIHTQSGNTAELQAILEEDRRKTIAEFDEFLRQREQDDRRRRFS